MQLSRNLSDWWLAEWSAAVTGGSAGPGMGWIVDHTRDWSGQRFLAWYSMFAAVNSVAAVARSFLFCLPTAAARGGDCLEVTVHRRLLTSVLSAPLSFFTPTPSGASSTGSPETSSPSTSPSRSRSYSGSPTPALSDVSLTLNAGETVLVCGRTGSGKTSLMLALWRLVDRSPDSDVLIDGVSIRSVPRHTLRRALACIPQDPHLFSGTVRFNLDPVTELSDDDLGTVLRQCGLAGETAGGAVVSLDSEVEDGGRNWSTGQIQLLCIGRALLRQAKVVCWDEATASTDAQTDAVIGRVLADCFRDATVIVISHRRVAGGVDRVVELDKGRVVEGM